MKKLLIFVHIIVLIGAYAPGINQWLSPDVFAYGNAFALAFPIIIIINLGLIFLWLLLKWRIGLLFMILSLPLYNLIQPWFPLFNSESSKPEDFSLITYNVRYFYDDYEGIKALMVKEKPTVIFFQEMGADPEGIVSALENEDAYFFENYNSLGIISEYPIIESNQIRYKDYPLCAVYGDIALPQDTVRFINTYLESLHLDQENIKNTKASTQDVKSKSKMLVTKVARASKIHLEQLKLIQKLIAQSPYPVIVGGDFNAVPTTIEYYQMTHNLKDAFVEAGHQPGHTFRSLKFPLKLDYVFTSPEIETVSYTIIPAEFSDHFPTNAAFTIP